MWVIGGLFVYLLARRIMGGGGALVAAAFYLYAPFGLAASRSFQVNPTMIGLSVIACWAIVQYFDQPTRRRLIAAILAAAAAIFTLIYAAFMIFPLFGWLALRRDGLRGALRRPHHWVFATLALLPSALYYLYGLTIGGFLAGQTGALFNPRLWLMGDYYVDWLGRVLVVIGLLPLLLSIQALVMARGLPAAVLRSL
jgi:4-amino-4-deoxy-L-arabinose transferase-like glycosyltransferase